MTRPPATLLTWILLCGVSTSHAWAADGLDVAFFEKKIRPILIKRCYECHSEKSQEQEGGLLLDRRSGWLKGGNTDKAVIPGNPDASLLVKAIRYQDDSLQMPPNKKLAAGEIALLEQWVLRGAGGPAEDLGDTAFSRLGDQPYLFNQAKTHWAFQPLKAVESPPVKHPGWNDNALDRLVFAHLATHKLTPSASADPRTLVRRLTFDLTGLPPTPAEVSAFIQDTEGNRTAAIDGVVTRLLDSPSFGEHVGRMWLDVARYADTDSFYRPDTKTPHYFPFAFTYRDYVIDAFNTDKPFDQFVREQLAADLMGLDDNAPEVAALGFLTVGPHANRNQSETIDDWIDVTTRGLMGITASCARCHDHKYEPIPTADYYSLHGIFASVKRIHPLDQDRQPLLAGYQPTAEQKADFEKQVKLAKKNATGKEKQPKTLRDTKIASLLLFHPGAPAHAMVVQENPKPTEQVIFQRGDPASPGAAVPRRFLKVLDSQQQPFSPENSGRLELANKIASKDNPLTARVFVNRVWGMLMGSHLVATASDFGLQGARPSHPQVLNMLAHDFVTHGWSAKHLVRTIVLSRTYQQGSQHRPDMVALDSKNQQLWRANRKRLNIEAIRDSLLAVSGKLDRTPRGRSAMLWGDDYTRRRSMYGYINRFNLDPTLRAFDFPAPMQTQGSRVESIVATQALFTMNSPFVIDQAAAMIKAPGFRDSSADGERVNRLFQAVFQRPASEQEAATILQFVKTQGEGTSESAEKNQAAWQLVAQALMMSNEFQYLD
ncbi:MAG: PSD1 and planctomycete cytochrome C domain-containing protein [Pirellulaceae bacterium]